MIGSTTRYSVDILQPAHPAPLPATNTVRLPALVNWPKGLCLGFQTGTGSPVNEQQTLTFGGTTSGGSFILQWNGPTQYQTGSIVWSATAATLVTNIQTQLDLLFGVGNAIAAGTSPYTIDFIGALAAKSIPLPTVISSLTGTSPTLTPSETGIGHPGLGLAQPYASGASDGRQTFRIILKMATSTDIFGQIITDRPELLTVARVYTRGVFFCSDLVGLDANAVSQAGRLINANTIATTGAVFCLN